MSHNLLEMQKISKRFPGVQALDQVDFGCVNGEVHALVGENGAGKSTLMKILAGAYRQDQGSILLEGEEIAFASPKKAQDHGISTIYQEFNLIPELSVVENIFLGREARKKGGIVIDALTQLERSKALLAKLGTNINPRTKVKKLSVADQQMVEIAKALSLNASIIIMDEPSAVVSGKELESLFQIIQSLKENGKAIIYISHRIDEVFQIADRATVLKDGRRVGTIRPMDADKAAIVKMMVGRSLSQTFPPKEQAERREILCLKNVWSGKFLKNISMKAYTGEILGVAGLVGSGRTGLARVIFGAEPFDSGEIYFEGKKIEQSNPKRSISKGIGFVTEDRKKEGFVSCLSVRKNLTALILGKLRKWGFTKEREERNLVRKVTAKFNIVTPSIEQEVQYLSGGNQQKVVLAKWINANPKLIILDEPTRGIDVGAKAEVYKTMRLLAKQGKALVMVSSELPEIIGMSDRILVMYHGRIVGEISGPEATEEGILMLATGQVAKNSEEGQVFED